MDHLDELEARSIYIIREAYKQFKKVAFLWSVGKDSTTLLWLIRKAFYGKIPFPLVHIDTGFHYPELIEWRDEFVKKWDLNLIVAKNTKALGEGMCKDKGAVQCCTSLKTQALKDCITEHKFRALYLGIRRDEHGVRAKERVFSPRNLDFKWDYKNQPPELWDQYKAQAEETEHIRVHPLLHWTEIDIWNYLQREKCPIIPMYFSKEGKRFRSLGCVPCCKPFSSDAKDTKEIIAELEATNTSERSGRAQDKEEANAMQKLRALGYM